MRNKKRAPIPEYRIDREGFCWDGVQPLWDVSWPCIIVSVEASVRALCCDSDDVREAVTTIARHPATAIWRPDLIIQHFVRSGPLGIAAASVREHRATTYGKAHAGTLPSHFY